MKVLLSFYDHLMISFAFNFNVMHISQHILIVSCSCAHKLSFINYPIKQTHFSRFYMDQSVKAFASNAASCSNPSPDRPKSLNR